ncbi:pentatricopeptide repeat-containing protein At5g66520-like [Zingiber officinale]|nr:pentatricopeptide repeat-containing protein At5g66520-like [Zingiber officinale]XP_042402303.1 pentatricopeptide repeat-containing protein At5g66520-like [Zingiber officinale]XP_042402304.1 pentatricopeptide repeat-containing protein At5g66520-like [Zingiber officinale]XP_042402305.1 pentatricopeptide repeat-containing protein At5g66520-like [Zingiber officinale]XP_042402306.1 pentatricopeptide repeat-containing protein At5g66520-like [Zingiber officinale]
MPPPQKSLVASLLSHPKVAARLNPNVAASLLPVLATPSPSLLPLRAAHALLAVSGSTAHKPVARHLILLYSRCFPDDAILLHSALRSPDNVSANNIIKSLVRVGSDGSRAVHFFACHAHPVGSRPSLSTFPLLITSAKLRESIHQGEMFHDLALKLGFLSKLPVANSLIHLYASCDALDLARQLLDEIPVKDHVSYNSVLDGYVKSCNFGQAEQLFQIMPSRSIISWSTLLNGYVRNKMFNKGILLFHQMQELGVEPDDCSLISVLSVYSQCKLPLHGKSVHGFLVRRWRRIPTHVSNAVVGFYCKCDLLEAAAEVFKRITNKDLICWNTLISGFGSLGRSMEAIGFFNTMLQEGVKPNDITFTCILVACAHSCLAEEAHKYFKMMTEKYNIKPKFAHYWCLVDLYVRAGNPEDALKAIQNMPLHNSSAIWGAVIWLAKVRGDISVGEHLGKCLIELEPYNSKRYAPLVNVYAAASRWDKYKELKDLMKARGLKRLPDSTLIDLNVVVHKFSVGDESQPEILQVYEMLKKIAEQLKLQHPRVEETTVDAI